LSLPLPNQREVRDVASVEVAIDSGKAADTCCSIRNMRSTTGIVAEQFIT